MNYFKSVWALEDKFRVIAIIVIAIVVLGLSAVDSVMDAAEFRENGGHMHME